MSEPAVTPEMPRRRRVRPLQLTVGTPPARLDIGSEADLLGATRPEEEALQLEQWTFNLKGYIRVPLRIGWGARNDGTSGNELHVPPRLVGLSSGDWEYIGIAPNPAVSLYANFGNPLVSANIIWGSSTTHDVGFENLDQMGGIRQAYLTLKFPDAFGERGGLALTAGAFSNRYGSAGREQVSSGFYGSYLFGRTHATGEVLTADIDLSDSLELILEHGVGAKLEVIPFLSDGDRTPGGSPEADFFKGTGPTPQGSNFLHHAHAGLIIDGWIRVAAHWMTSWSPVDNGVTSAGRNETARLTVTGAEIHLDDEAWGNGFLGFSHVDATNLMPLSDAIQLLHASDGRGFKEEYFGGKERIANFTPTNDSGTLDTVLFQYVLRLAPFTERMPFGARDMSLAIYSMLNHAVSEKTNAADPLQLEIDDWKLKFGAQAQLALFKYMTLGIRADHVQPCLRCRRGAPESPGGPPSFVTDNGDAYSAISPSMIFHSTWKTKEYVVVNYTHYFLGPEAYPSSPYSDYTKADADLFMIALAMSF